jgi:hypothetical protein
MIRAPGRGRRRLSGPEALGAPGVLRVWDGADGRGFFPSKKRAPPWGRDHGRSSDSGALWRSRFLRFRFPAFARPVPLNLRSLLPLRGSAGVTPASHFQNPAEPDSPGGRPKIWCLSRGVNPNVVPVRGGGGRQRSAPKLTSARPFWEIGDRRCSGPGRSSIGNPVRFRDCPAAVSENEPAIGTGSCGNREAAGCRDPDFPEGSRVRRPADARARPTSARGWTWKPRGRVEGSRRPHGPTVPSVHPPLGFRHPRG